MRKSTTEISATHHSVNFHADKPYHSAPKIKSLFNKHGEVWYKFENGNTQSRKSYLAFWVRSKEPIKAQNAPKDFNSKFKI